MQMIASHMERTFLFRDLPSEDRTLSDLLGSVMARAGFGLILATADRRIIYANDAAETFMRASNGLRRERNSISAADFTSSRKLQSLITAASRQAEEAAQGGSLILRDEDGMASFVVHVVPLAVLPLWFRPRGSGLLLALLWSIAREGPPIEQMSLRISLA